MDDVTFPDDLTVLSDDELSDLETQLVEEFDRLHDEGSRDVAALTDLVTKIQALKNEREAREQAQAEADAAIADLMETVHPSAETPETPEGEEGDDGEDEDETEGAEDKEPEPVTAAARRARPTARDIGRRAPRPRVPERRPEVVITAAADVPGLPVSSRINLLQLAQGFHDRARGLNDGSPRVPVGRVNIPIPASNQLGDNPDQNYETILRVVGNQSAAALVASGGWCAPSVPIYDLFEIGDSDGLLDLPTVGAVRGGMLIPTFYTIGDVAGALWNWTEANDIAAATQPAGPDKPCLKIPCPTWTDVRLEAEGLCVTHGNLSDRAFPELTRNFINLVMVGHQHRVSAAKIAKIVSGATAVTPAAGMLTSDAAGDLLGVLALQAADLRSQYRAARSRAVDVLLPDWTIEILRTNMAKRAGIWNAMNVTDGEITSWLTARGVRPQYLSDYQPLYNAAPATGWPSAVEFTMFFSGSYVEADGGSIDLGVVRDSVLNSTNDYTAAWSEQFFAIGRIGPLARKVSVTLTPDGVTACCP